MINSLWSLCGSCPSAPIDKIPPEYRHVRNRRQGWNQTMQESLRQESYPIIDSEPSGQGILDPLVSAVQSVVVANLYETNDSVELEQHGENESGVKRSGGTHSLCRSEGPSPRVSPRISRRIISDGRSLANSLDRGLSRSPDRSRDSSPFSSQTAVDMNQATTTSRSEYTWKYGWPPGDQDSQSSTSQADHHPRKSASMNLQQVAQNKHRSNFTGNQSEMEGHALLNGDGEHNENDDDKPTRRPYNTEYTKKFRPFSLYQYVDGHFEKAKSMGDPVAADECDAAHAECAKGEPWHKEVTELRKKATEFKQRGWGIESLPEHLHSLYVEQGTVWDQVSRRSTLAALALASATPRSESRDGSDPSRRLQKSGRAERSESTRRRVRDDNSRPRRDHSIAARSDRSTMSAPVDRRALSAGKHRPPLAVSSAPTSAQSTPKMRLGAVGRSVSVGREVRAKRAAARTPTSVGPPPPQTNGDARQGRRKPENAEEGKPRDKREKSRSTSPKPKRSLSVRANARVRQVPPANVSKSRSFTHAKAIPSSYQMEVESKRGYLETSLDPLLKDEIFLHPLQKAPAEPTRVKSPETLLVRSPDPVNWTVPIETTKPLNPTQGAKQADGTRCHGELRVTMNVRPLEKPAHAPTVPISAGVRFKKPLEEMIPPHGLVAKPPMHSAEPAKPSSVVSPMKQQDFNANAERATNGHKVVSPPEAMESPRFGTSPMKSPDPKSKFSDKTDIPIGKVEPIRVQPIAKPVPCSTLRCLDDPSFLFDTPIVKPCIPPTTPKISGGTTVVEPMTQQYRVLEAEGVPSDVLYQPTSFSPYKVLEAPTSPVDPSIPPLVSPSSGKSLASDVLEKARSRFDRFWGKKDGV